MTTTLSTFARAYIECALWSSTDDNDEPLDANYSIDDLAPETLAKMQADCEQFEKENAAAIAQYSEETDERDTQIGHDFWLTRNRHGAGFWESDSSQAQTLTDASHDFGSCDLYVGDDGLIYC
jgi:hypothetical protein